MREIVSILQDTYCGSIGVEYMHIQDPDQKRRWIQERIEQIRNQVPVHLAGKAAILERLTAGGGLFEKFLDKKYTGTKRFGLDGGESLIPAMEQIIKRGSQVGVEEVVIGMAHRGRLNVLATSWASRSARSSPSSRAAAAHPEDVGARAT